MINSNTLFVNDTTVPVGCVSGAVINLNNVPTNNTNTFTSLINLTNKKIKILVSSQDAGTLGTAKWTPGKKLADPIVLDETLRADLINQFLKESGCKLTLKSIFKVVVSLKGIFCF
ncbi:hypothetical protein [Spiroplasma endosymbiont of Nebria brevicollis]|uniref:hypothetical protein n=1 Tax=Spiroplasma endosymbiont of Nebria brevicollis TaxID=3066284 RepID=UPI00313CD5AA